MYKTVIAYISAQNVISVSLLAPSHCTSSLGFTWLWQFLWLNRRPENKWPL